MIMQMRSSKGGGSSPDENARRLWQRRDRYESTYDERCFPSCQNIGPEVFLNTYVDAVVVVVRHTDGPAENLGESYLSNLRHQSSGIEKENEVLEVCIEVEPVRADGEAVGAFHRGQVRMGFFF